VRAVRYVLAMVFVLVGLALVALPLNEVLRNEESLSGGLWLLEVALGVPAFAVAVWLWPGRDERTNHPPEAAA
jgi:hypothetical protein